MRKTSRCAEVRLYEKDWSRCAEVRLYEEDWSRCAEVRLYEEDKNCCAEVRLYEEDWPNVEPIPAPLLQGGGPAGGEAQPQLQHRAASSQARDSLFPPDAPCTPAVTGGLRAL